MANPGQPTVKPGDTGEGVRRLQRAVRRTGDPELVVDGNFGPETESALKLFQEGEGLTVDGICGPDTWDALPDGGPMPILKQGSSGAVVSALQSVLTSGAPQQWRTTPNGVDGSFGPMTEASVKAFQAWGGVLPDGIVGDRTWSASLHAAGATLETAVGLNFVVD